METLDQPPKEYEVLKHSSVPGPNKGEESQTVRIEIDGKYSAVSMSGGVSNFYTCTGYQRH